MVKPERKVPAVPCVEKVADQRFRIPRAVPEIDPFSVDFVGDRPVDSPRWSIDCAEVKHDRHWTVPINVTFEKRPEILPAP